MSSTRRTKQSHDCTVRPFISTFDSLDTPFSPASAKRTFAPDARNLSSFRRLDLHRKIQEFHPSRYLGRSTASVCWKRDPCPAPSSCRSWILGEHSHPHTRPLQGAPSETRPRKWSAQWVSPDSFRQSSPALPEYGSQPTKGQPLHYAEKIRYSSPQMTQRGSVFCFKPSTISLICGVAECSFNKRSAFDWISSVV